MGTKSFVIRILLSLLFVFHAFAEEEGESHEAGEASAAAASPEQRANKELADLEKQVASLSAKIKAKNESIEHLLAQKSVEPDPAKLSELIKLVQQEHKEVQELTREYNTQRGVLQYRFPERGMTLGRRYQRLNTRSLEEMEKTLGLEGDLKKSRDKVKMVYGIKEKPASKKDASKKNPAAEERLLQPATLSK